MKKLISLAMLIAMTFAIVPAESYGQAAKADVKAAKSQAKKLEKQGWQTEGATSLENGLVKIAQKEAAGFTLLLGTSYGSQKSNVAKTKARNNAINEFAEYGKSIVKARINTKVDDIDSEEVDNLVSGYERMVVRELDNLIPLPSLILRRDNNGSIDYQCYYMINEQALEVQGIKIDEYWERRDDGKVYLTTLFARSQNDAKPRFDNVKLTTKYGMRGFWRSAIVPGWGQLYKGSTVKGSLILGGTAVLIGATIYTDCMRADYAHKINKTHIAENKRAYATRRDNFTTCRNICIGTLGALYVYNLIDAIVAPGARRIQTASKSNRNFSYNIGPTLLEDCTPALAMQITF